MQITLITVGTLKEDYLRRAVQEYQKRISAYAQLEIVELKEERIPDEDDPSRVSAALQAEGKRILDAIPRGACKVALCVEGKQLSSEELAHLVGNAADASGKLALIIGSSHGLDPAVKGACDVHLSVSRLTFPHQLMRVILTEALYRSLTILAGKRYHK